ncbi:cysteine desulfurase [Pustulibacterium marinum]|uniref:cysteine desulfurase n=1 Tax=Pustulibacterium marinum TaxID=1224947 RepID=A0A1I7IRC5_9FLAO|nr:cysteine desulfurase family protein [Pustulibacterium marinum]SFU75515.1 cysteine desulfurase [Pustulibacterium marinum]
MQKSLIYLDNNATTPIDKRVLDEMIPFLTTNFANANSTHQFGVDSHNAVKKSRKEIAELIGAETNEIIFTSGATESINIAIKGIADSYQNKGKHIITVSTEHSAVLDTCKYLESKGFEITYLPVKSDGTISLEKLKETLRDDTILVSVMYVNNETGVIQPIKQISQLTHSVGAIFMTDATQAVGKIDIDVDDLGIDLLSMSGHKIYACKGVGALYIRQRKTRIKIPALLHGGGHERNMRSGTLNVPGIVSLGKACELARKEMIDNKLSIIKLRDYLETELLKIPDTTINGNRDNRLFNVTNLCFKGADSEAIIMGLSSPDNVELPLIAVSNGSACTSMSIDPSHVLIAMGLSENEAFNSIRFSIGKENTLEEIKIVINSVSTVVSNLRSMSF